MRGDQFNFCNIISATLLGISSHSGDSKFIIIHTFTSSKLKGKHNIACEFNCEPCKLSCVSRSVLSIPQVINGTKVSPSQMCLVPLSECQSISCEESKCPWWLLLEYKSMGGAHLCTHSLPSQRQARRLHNFASCTIFSTCPVFTLKLNTHSIMETGDLQILSVPQLPIAILPWSFIVERKKKGLDSLLPAYFSCSLFTASFGTQTSEFMGDPRGQIVPEQLKGRQMSSTGRRDSLGGKLAGLQQRAGAYRMPTLDPPLWTDKLWIFPPEDVWHLCVTPSFTMGAILQWDACKTLTM